MKPTLNIIFAVLLLPDHVTFAGHFVDDVRASINIRQSVSNHGSEALP